MGGAIGEVLTFLLRIVLGLTILMGVAALLVDVWRMFFGTNEDRIIVRAERDASERLAKIAARVDMSVEQKRREDTEIADRLENWRTVHVEQAARHEKVTRTASISLLLLRR